VSWAEQSIVRFIRQMPRPDARIWLDIGTAEGSSPGMARQVVSSVRALRRTLLHQGFVLGKDLAYHEVSGAGHHEGAWAARVDPMLRFLYPPPSGVRAPRSGRQDGD
jgi:predicted alpha/beta superfamily hydrolase